VLTKSLRYFGMVKNFEMTKQTGFLEINYDFTEYRLLKNTYFEVQIFFYKKSKTKYLYIIH